MITRRGIYPLTSLQNGIGVQIEPVQDSFHHHLGQVITSQHQGVKKSAMGWIGRGRRLNGAGRVEVEPGRAEVEPGRAR